MKYEYSRSNVFHSESNCAATSDAGGEGPVGELDPQAVDASVDSHSSTSSNSLGQVIATPPRVNSCVDAWQRPRL